MKSEKLQFDRSLATDSEATYRLRTKSHHSLDAGIGGTFYSIPVDSYRNFRRILLYAAMRTISSAVRVQLYCNSIIVVVLPNTWNLLHAEIPNT